VLILAERGSPVEELAKVIHEGAGGVSGRPWVGVRCEGRSESELEKELFGEVDGECPPHAAVERARGGTLFISSISDVGSSAQARLAPRIRLAGTDGFRLVTATSLDLRTAVVAGRLRNDLAGSLSKVVISIPPLRKRPEDIESLAMDIAREQGLLRGKQVEGISPEGLSKLRGHSYPGNEAELDRSITRAVATHPGAVIGASSIDFDSSPSTLAAVFVGDAASSFEEEIGRPPTLAEVERAYLIWALRHTNINRTAAARLLGISYPTIAKKISDFQIDLASLAEKVGPVRRRIGKTRAD
jgi:DNA-binding NtrC family response regulator